jgi:hypothetical protein
MPGTFNQFLSGRVAGADAAPGALCAALKSTTNQTYDVRVTEKRR